MWANKTTMPLINNRRNTCLAAPGALAHRLQRRTACKIQNGRQGAPKWATGTGKGSIPRLLALSSNFLDPSNSEKKKKKKEEKKRRKKKEKQRRKKEEKKKKKKKKKEKKKKKKKK